MALFFHAVARFTDSVAFSLLGDVTNAGGGHPAPFAPPYPHPYGYGYYVPPPPPPPRQMQAPSGADGRRGA